MEVTFNFKISPLLSLSISFLLSKNRASTLYEILSYTLCLLILISRT